MLSSTRIAYLFASLLALPIGCTLIAAPDPDQICASDAEVCDDGLDNDCDGQVDEDCVCTEGEEQACYSGPAGTKGIGICKEGTQKCESGAWGACVGAVLPGTEIVDGQDNDCDGEADEDINCLPNEPYPCYDGPSGTSGVGICKEGMQQKCVAMGACVGQVLPSTEVCNGLDDDCDGEVDNGDVGTGVPCLTGMPGACSQGITVCEADGLHCMPNVMPTTETCNAIDDDCNGQVDEGPFCCPDGVQNGNETDVDCGGSCITKCALGKKCGSSMDCQTNTCDPTTKLCSQKAPGYPCLLASECASGFCVDGICCDSACDGTCMACSALKKSSGVDGTCGPIAANIDPDNDCVDQGPTSCGTTGVCDGAGACALYPTGTVCQNGTCNNGVCEPPTCNDGVQNGDETGIDCGGSCPACPTPCACVHDAECAFGAICVMCMCMPPTCYDGMQSGDETDIDCGGYCVQKCQVGQTCLVNADCASGTCTNGICQP